MRTCATWAREVEITSGERAGKSQHIYLGRRILVLVVSLFFCSCHGSLFSFVLSLSFLSSPTSLSSFCLLLSLPVFCPATSFRLILISSCSFNLLFSSYYSNFAFLFSYFFPSSPLLGIERDQRDIYHVFSSFSYLFPKSPSSGMKRDQRDIYHLYYTRQEQ